MGLDTSHDCWHGPYSQFMRWRVWLARQVDIPLELMEGFCTWCLEDTDLAVLDPIGYGNPAFAVREIVRGAIGCTPIPWSILRPDPLHILLHHSDCDGRIHWWDARPIAVRLGQISRGVPNDHDPARPPRGCYDGMVPATKRFATGLLRAYRAREDVRFH